MPKWSIFLKSEKTKPSEKRGFAVGPMVTFEWEKTMDWLKSKAKAITDAIQRK
jgi:hypothetical protein